MKKLHPGLDYSDSLHVVLHSTQGYLPPKSLQIKEIIGEWNLKIICFWQKTFGNTPFLNPKPIKETLGIILKKAKKNIEGATVVKYVNKVHKLQYLH